MCWHHNSKPKPNGTKAETMRGLQIVDPAASSATPEFWKCSEAVYDVCFDQLHDEGDSSRCQACVMANRTALATRGCENADSALRVCSANKTTCDSALRKLCPEVVSGKQSDTLACQTCAKAQEAELNRKHGFCLLFSASYKFSLFCTCSLCKCN
jgi:hypothetical protein